MGDHYETVVDLDATLAEAPELAERVLAYLVQRRIVQKTPTPCVLSDADGHAPGTEAGLAFDGTDEQLMNWTVIGVEFTQERTVFYAIDGSQSVVCDSCSQQTEFDGTNDEEMFAWQDAVSQWYEGNDEALFACPRCSASAKLTGWRHDPPWAFGFFAVVFWNCPPLRPSFINELGDFLGHRVQLVRGRY